MITHAAIRYPNGLIRLAKRHHRIIKAAYEDQKTKSHNTEQGFMRDDWYFMTRDEAKEHAIAEGQIPADFSGTLYSEDLWPSETLTPEER